VASATAPRRECDAEMKAYVVHKNSVDPRSSIWISCCPDIIIANSWTEQNVVCHESALKTIQSHSAS